MEFLLSPAEEQPTTVLALLIASSDSTDLIVYSWQEKAPLTTAKLKATGYDRLPTEDRMPLLMIPSNHGASFTLVTESGLTVYDDVIYPEIRRIHIEVPQSFPPDFVGSCRSPLWVQWAKPCRHSEYLKTNDDFFLIRENGELDYFEILHNTPSKVHSRSGVATVNTNVDSAFAILESFLYEGGDICVVGGDMNDSAVCHMMARTPLNRIQTITNLAPLQDMLLLDTTNRDEGAQRKFVCSGKGDGHAAVAEIRHGLEARVGFIAEQEDASMATGLWLLPEPSRNHLALLVSYPSQTSVFRISYETRELENTEDDFGLQGMQLDCQTLAVAAIDETILVQITPSAITMLSLLPKMNSVTSKCSNRSISIATINLEHMLIATVAKANGLYEVLLTSINVDDASCGIDDLKAHSMVEEPSSLLMCDMGGVQLLLVGTIDGSIRFLAIDQDSELRFVSQSSMLVLFPHVETSAVCSLALLADVEKRLPALACGTRNGWLFGMTILSDLLAMKTDQEETTNIMLGEQSDVPNALALQPESAQRIGQTSVKLTSDPDKRSTALLFCDSEVYHLSIWQPGWSASFKVSRIWFTDALEVGLGQSYEVFANESHSQNSTSLQLAPLPFSTEMHLLE